MLPFNRKEQLAILVLCAALLVGIGVSLVSELRDEGLPEFQVIRNAVPVPENSAGAGPVGARTDTIPVRGPINVNTASMEELQRLPRVGPATARRIVEYRTRNGRFDAAEDLALVQGIGPKTVDRLKPLIVFDSQ